MQNSKVVFNFFLLDQKDVFLANLVQENQIVVQISSKKTKFKLNFGT